MAADAPSRRVVVCRGGQDESCVANWLTVAHDDGEEQYDEVLRDVSGKMLVVAFDALRPYVMSGGRGRQATLTGYLGDLWAILETTLGFRSVYVRATGNTARLMMQSGVADVYLAATVVTTEEDDLFDHTQPVVTHWYHLFVPKGVPEVSADSYVRAMSPAMWVMTLAAVVLLCLVLRAMIALRTALGMRAGVEPASSSLGSCFLSVLGSICSQGWQESPSCVSVRLTVVTTLLFGYLLYNAYAAVLISHLAAGHYAAPFSTLDDVAKKGTHALCVRNESYAFFTLKRSSEWNRVLNRGVCRDASKAERLAEALCEYDAVALEIPSVMAAAVDARPDCRDKVLRVRTRMQRATASLLLRKGFPYTRAIDYVYAITRCRASGVLDRLEKTYLDDPSSVSSSQDSYGGNNVITMGVQVTLDHVRWVLALYAAFLAVPLLVLSGESVVAWRTRVARIKRARGRRRGRGRWRVGGVVPDDRVPTLKWQP